MREYLGDALYSRIFHYRSEEVTSVFRHLQHAGVIPPNDGMKLFQMATALGIDFEDSKLHGALYDAEVTRQIARELHKRSEVLKYDLPRYLSIVQCSVKFRVLEVDPQCRCHLEQLHAVVRRDHACVLEVAEHACYFLAPIVEDA
jgi:DNA polymerase III epsilon subunit-like protein